MAARLDPNPSSPDSVQRARLSLYHVVVVASWNNLVLLQAVRQYVLPQMTGRHPISAWVVDDNGFPKKGKHSVGVAQQSCGLIGKRDNCQATVNLSVGTESASLPIAYELYLPETWSEDRERRRKAGVPDEVVFRTQPLIAAEQMQRAVADGVPRAPVFPDAAYGNDTKLRQARLNMGAGNGTGIDDGHSTNAVRMASGHEPLPPKLRQSVHHQQPGSVQDLAAGFHLIDWKTLLRRNGTKKKLESRFAAVRAKAVDPGFRAQRAVAGAMAADRITAPNEWPQQKEYPTKYWLGNPAADTNWATLVATPKRRWIIE